MGNPEFKGKIAPEHLERLITPNLANDLVDSAMARHEARGWVKPSRQELHEIEAALQDYPFIVTDFQIHKFSSKSLNFSLQAYPKGEGAELRVTISRNASSEEDTRLMFAEFPGKVVASNNQHFDVTQEPGHSIYVRGLKFNQPYRFVMDPTETR